MRCRVTADSVTVLMIGNRSKMISIFKHFGGNFFDRQHVVNKPCRGGALRHSAHRGVVKLGLSDRKSPIFLDRFQSKRAISSGP